MTQKLNNFDVKPLKTVDIIPYARNPRKNEAAVSKTAASIQEFGWRQPIVVDEDMVVIAGHTRLEAAKRLKHDLVPVHVAKGLTAAQVKAYRLADNRVGQEAEWDFGLLRLELQEIDFDSMFTGFDPAEIEALTLDGTGGLTDPDAIPEPPLPVTKLGDIWDIGKHRVLCGDATIATDVEKLLCDVRPHLMVTDPPYGVNYDPDWRNVAERADGTPLGASAVGVVANDHNADWSDAYALFPGDVAYVWHAGNKAHVVAESIVRSGFEIRAQIIWAKNNIVIGRGHYHPKHEPCWYAVRKQQVGHWSGSRKESTVWNIDKPMKSETGHSTQKPVECMRRPIVNNSSPGQAVYDPFLGSGTTVIAAETEGRRCFGLEIEPAYCDIVVKRWQDFTGDTPVLNGKEYVIGDESIGK